MVKNERQAYFALVEEFNSNRAYIQREPKPQSNTLWQVLAVVIVSALAGVALAYMVLS